MLPPRGIVACVGLILLAPELGACLEKPDFEGRLCSDLEPCPRGWMCAPDRRCRRNVPGDPITERDASASFDMASMDGAFADAPASDALTGGVAIDTGFEAEDGSSSDSTSTSEDAGEPVDMGIKGADDAAQPDALGPLDAALPDSGGHPDGRETDAEPADAGAAEDAAPPFDGGFPDAGFPDAAVAPVDLTIGVAGSSEDALQDPGGPMLVAYPWVSLYSDDHWGAIRFQVPSVPQGAVIDDAYLELYVDGLNEDDPAVRIYAEPTASPAPLSTTASDISDRPRSANSVEWISTSIGEGFQRTPGLSSLVQEIVNLPSWTPGSSILFIFDSLPPASVLFEFRQYDHSADLYAARIFIRYRPN